MAGGAGNIKIMKRRVQAQRKFALGAIIPSNNSAANNTQRAKNSPPPSNPSNPSIINSNLPAKSLLDYISMQSVHTHSGPVVLIKRMAPEIMPSTSQESEEVGDKRPKNTSTDLSSPPPIKRRTFKIQRKNRQRHTSNNKPKPTKQINMKIKRTFERTCSMSTSDWEDERPLKYLKKSVPQPRVTRSSQRLQKKPSSTVVHRTSDTSATSGDRVHKRSITAPQEKGDTPPAVINRRSGSSPSSGERVTTRSTALQEKTQNTAVPVINHQSGSSPASGERVTTRRTQEKTPTTPVADKKNKTPKKTTANETPTAKEPPTKDPETPSTFKQPAIPARFTKTAGQNKRSTSNRKLAGKQNDGVNVGASTSKGLGTRTTRAASSWQPKYPDAMVLIPGRYSYQYYDTTNIERWISGDDITKTEETQDDGVCPSENLRTVNDVRNASPATLAKRCHTCKACYRVNVVIQITGLLSRCRTPLPRGNSDVYDFDDNEDTSNPPPVYSPRNRNLRGQGNDDTAPDEEDEDEQRIYLDINENSPTIVEITSKVVPNSEKKMITARLKLKSQAQPIKDVLLVEHENLLAQLLETLTDNEMMDSDLISTIHNDNSAANMRSSGKRPWATDRTEQQMRIPKIRPEPEKKTPKLVEAPTFYPTAAEFADPIAYFEKIAPQGARYGLCKVKLPDNFEPKCILNDEFKFNVANHYVARMYSRWGPAAREICAMRAYLATQNVFFNRVPLLDSIEVNLPKLYSVVQRQGGLERVLEDRRMSKVAEEMGIKKGPNTEKILDRFYVKYLVPFDTASNQERDTILSAVERCWLKKHRKLVEWASNPLHQQKKLMGESDSSEDESSPNDDWIANKALYEAEDCVVTGRPMHLSGFKKVATKAMAMYMKGKQNPSVEEVESEYWRLALFGTEHVCVNAASIDTATAGYGFSTNKDDACSKHPWNLKMLTLNSNNVLRSINTVLGVTIPTLHLGMVFSTCCWHRDPHGLPWTEYMHSGPPKIWYGIPEDQSSNFRKAVETLCPTSCQNKYIWLSSDITMIPPNLLLEHNVSLSHTLQNPGEFIIVFPQSYSCSISTGFTVSESVYFAPFSWLQTVHQIYQELRSSCEPTAFALEHLLFSLAKDPRSSLSILHTVHSSLKTIVDEELRHRKALVARGLPVRPEDEEVHVRGPGRRRSGPVYSTQDEAECKICRTTLYMSKVIGLLDKKIYFCPMHAIRMLETHQYTEAELAKIEVVVFYTDKQLEDIMHNLMRRLFPKPDRRS